nr:WRKY transcription factor 55-like isoform X2 [Ipomoea trifida]
MMMSRPKADHLKIISKKQQEMDDNIINTATTSPALLMMTILRGIQLAKDLEPNLAHNLATERDYIARACDDIVRVFSGVRERVSSSSPPQITRPPPQLGGVLDHTWLMSTTAHDPQLFHPHMVAPPPLPAQPVTAALRVHRSGSGGGGGELAHHQPAAQRPRRPR